MKWAKRGREMAQDFSVEKMIEKIDVLYESLLHSYFVE